jgi:hypothetical protein
LELDICGRLPVESTPIVFFRQLHNNVRCRSEQQLSSITDKTGREVATYLSLDVMAFWMTGQSHRQMSIEDERSSVRAIELTRRYPQPHSILKPNGINEDSMSVYWVDEKNRLTRAKAI